MISNKPNEQAANQDANTEEQVLSKSARKREMVAFQDLARTLIDLPANQFSRLPLSDRVSEAIKLAKSLKHTEARRRQLLYIGKSLRAENHQQIKAALQQTDDTNRFFRQRLQRLEKMRDGLIANGNEALQSLISDHPELDRQHLRQLIRQVHKEDLPEKRSTKNGKLFEYLRKTLELD